MANNENLIPIPGRLHSVATEGHVAGADEIYDDTQQKDQGTINSELISAVGTGGSVDSKIATAKTEIIGDATTDYNTLGKLEDKIQAEATRAEVAEEALDGRVDTLEEAVGTGGSVDSRISAAVATETTRAQAAEVDRYTKAETYNKNELNNMITTPNQEYVSVIATAQTTAVTDVLPATGAADTTYRVGNWDGTQYNDSVFSEYAWNGSAYIKLSTKSQIGEVYDISANHADTKYADLAAALGTNGANIPQSLRKGGMSVKFVQSSDNRYVQFRYMLNDAATNSKFVNIANWQDMDTDTIRHQLLNKYFVGQGTTFSYSYIYGLIPGRTYEVLFEKTLWEIDSDIPDNNYVMEIWQNVTGSESSTTIFSHDAYNFKNNVPIQESYKVTIPEGINYLGIGGRAVANSKVRYSVRDITDAVSVDNIHSYTELQKAVGRANIGLTSVPINVHFFNDLGINADGREITDYGYKLSNFIKIDKNAVAITITTSLYSSSSTVGYSTAIVFYDNSKNLIPSLSISADDFVLKGARYVHLENYIIPISNIASAEYIRFTDRRINTTLFNIQFIYENTNLKKGIQINSFNITGKSNWSRQSLNEDGSISTTSVSLLSAKIPVDSGSIKVSYSRNDSNFHMLKFAFYDENEVVVNSTKWLGPTDMNDGTIPVPQNAVAFRVATCLKDGSGDIVTSQQDLIDENFEITYRAKELSSSNNTFDVNKLNFEKYTYNAFHDIYGYDTNTRYMTILKNNSYKSVTVHFANEYCGSIQAYSEDANSIGALSSDGSSMLANAVYTTIYPHTIKLVLPDNTKTIGIWIRRIDNGTFTEADCREAISIEFDSDNNVDTDYALIKNYRSWNGSTVNEVLSLLHFSDIHEDMNGLMSVVRFMNAHKDLDDAICTGDHHKNYWTQDYTYWDKANAGKILDVIGNHDTPNATREQIYNRFIAPHVSEWNVTQPSNAATDHLNYYYKDYNKTNAKIRLIVLDCMFYDTTQNTWFTNVLADALSNNLSVIVAEHYQGGLPLEDIPTKMNDANLFGYFGGSSGDMEKADANAVSAISSFIDNGGEFICWLTGHTHDSRFTHIQEDRRQLCIVVSSQASGDYAVCKAYNRFGKNVDMFNVYSFDTTNKLIKVLRVGANKNILMRGCETLCYDYKNNILLSEEDTVF